MLGLLAAELHGGHGQAVPLLTAYVPASQAVQEDALGPEAVPAPHDVQLPHPLLPQYLPAAQPVHEPEAVPEYVPDPHCVQEAHPVDEYVPDSHCAQEAHPDNEYVPAPQSLQLPELLVSVYLPALQSVHPLLFAPPHAVEMYLPAAHVSQPAQEAELYPVLYVPPGQVVHPRLELAPAPPQLPDDT